MDIKILKEEKSVLPRKELEAVVSFEKETPSRQDIKAEMTKQLKTDEKLVIIKKIQTYFGNNEAKISAHVYDNEDALKSIEFKTMVEKNKKVEPKKEEKAEEAPAEAPKEEAKPKEKEEPAAEEKKEEPKKEETPKEEAKPEEKKEDEAPKEEAEKPKEGDK